MAYTPPVVFAPGVLEAADLNQNLDELAEYLSLGIDAAAEIADGSVTSSKILRPRTTLVSDRVTSTYFQTGSIHHVRLSALDYIAFSPLSAVPYQSSGFITSQYHTPVNPQPVPGTWVSFHLPETATAVIIRWQGEILIPQDFTGSTDIDNQVMAALDGTPALESMCRTREMSTLLDNFDRRQMASCAIFTASLTPGWHSAGLLAGWLSNFGLLSGLELTIEVIL